MSRSLPKCKKPRMISKPAGATRHPHKRYVRKSLNSRKKETRCV